MMQVAPFPQGDLKAKQQIAAGHRWGSVIDFAAGYYAVPIADESVPYIGFYVEGRGYYVYLRMPFGLMGAPATFCEMVSIILDDMMGRELVNWMDDIFLPGDDFDTKIKSLPEVFIRCRDRKLSLAPSKCKLFFTELFFAGAIVGPDGVMPSIDLRRHGCNSPSHSLNFPIPYPTTIPTTTPTLTLATTKAINQSRRTSRR
jgi:hypothetical protein